MPVRSFPGIEQPVPMFYVISRDKIRRRISLASAAATSVLSMSTLFALVREWIVMNGGLIR
jgi:hypothetical protein